MRKISIALFVFLSSQSFADQWLLWNKQNSPLPSDTITAIFVEPNGRIWIGTPAGLVSSYQQLWNVYTTDNSMLPSNHITSLVYDNDTKTLWIGTSQGLVSLRNHQWSIFTTQNSPLPSNEIRKIARAPSGALWIATNGGLAEYYRLQWNVFTRQNSNLPSDKISALSITPAGDIWIGTDDAGIAVKTGAKWHHYSEQNSPLPSNIVLSLCTVNEAVWIGLWGTGLVKFNFHDTLWSFFDNTNSPLPHNWVTVIAPDSCGTLWLGTRAGGAARKGLWLWEIFTPQNSSLPSYSLFSIFPQNSGTIWFGTSAGLARVELSPAIDLRPSTPSMHCNNPLLSVQLSLRGLFSQSNIFTFAILQNGEMDTLTQQNGWCDAEYELFLENRLSAQQFAIVVLSSSPQRADTSAPVISSIPTPTIAGDTTFCAGDTAYLRVEESFLRYQWSTGDTTAAIRITDGGTYTVTVTDTNGCSATATIEVTQHPAPRIRASGDTSICEGTYAQLSVTGGMQYFWQPRSTLNDPTSPHPIAFPEQSTTYIVTGINEWGCIGYDTVQVTVLPSPQKPTITQRGDTLLSSPAFQYQWYRNSAPIPGATQQFYIPRQPGIYFVQITNEYGCSAFSDSISIITNSVTTHMQSPCDCSISSARLLLRCSSFPISLSLYSLEGKIIAQYYQKTSPVLEVLTPPLPFFQPIIIKIETPEGLSRFLSIVH